jgi:hypothetical protein
MSFFCLTEGQADGGPISLARALTASYGACSPYPRYIIFGVYVRQKMRDESRRNRRLCVCFLYTSLLLRLSSSKRPKGSISLNI